VRRRQHGHGIDGEWPTGTNRAAVGGFLYGGQHHPGAVGLTHGRRSVIALGAGVQFEGTDHERFANRFANKLPKTVRYGEGRVGATMSKKPNYQGLLGFRTNRGGRPRAVFKTGALNRSAIQNRPDFGVPRPQT
jgi:hypothetical protein